MALGEHGGEHQRQRVALADDGLLDLGRAPGPPARRPRAARSSVRVGHGHSSSIRGQQRSISARLSAGGGSGAARRQLRPEQAAAAGSSRPVPCRWRSSLVGRAPEPVAQRVVGLRGTTGGLEQRDGSATSRGVPAGAHRRPLDLDVPRRPAAVERVADQPPARAARGTTSSSSRHRVAARSRAGAAGRRTPRRPRRRPARSPASAAHGRSRRRAPDLRAGSRRAPRAAAAGPPRSAGARRTAPRGRARASVETARGSASTRSSIRQRELRRRLPRRARRCPAARGLHLEAVPARHDRVARRALAASSARWLAASSRHLLARPRAGLARATSNSTASRLAARGADGAGVRASSPRRTSAPAGRPAAARPRPWPRRATIASTRRSPVPSPAPVDGCRASAASAVGVAAWASAVVGRMRRPVAAEHLARADRGRPGHERGPRRAATPATASTATTARRVPPSSARAWQQPEPVGTR